MSDNTQREKVNVDSPYSSVDTTYRPAAQMADSIFNDLVCSVAEKHSGLGKVLVETGVAVVGIHGEREVKNARSCQPLRSKKCCDKRYEPHRVRNP